MTIVTLPYIELLRAYGHPNIQESSKFAARENMNFLDFEKALASLMKFMNESSPEEITNYVNKVSSKNAHLSQKEIARKIIYEHSLKNGVLGAVTGALGVVTLPATIPTDIIKSWKIHVFIIRSIAFLYGYAIDRDEFEIEVSLLMTCNSIKEIEKTFKEALQDEEYIHNLKKSHESKKAISTQARKQILKKSPKYVAKSAVKSKIVRKYALSGTPKYLRKITWKIGGKKMAERAIQKSLTKAVPIIGAVGGFAFDWFGTEAVGKLAIEYYENSWPEKLNDLANQTVN